MRVLVTGAAGFIGMHTALALLDRGHQVWGFDNLSPYYDPALKEARLAALRPHENFTFIKGDLVSQQAVLDAVKTAQPQIIIHLAAQAGVRYSLKDPDSYINANVLGHTHMLEAARQAPNLLHFIYASSSSVYGNSKDVPFREDQVLPPPASLYAATKRSVELISDTYGQLYDLPQTGLRFFTVYGPWGRPDMAPWLFTEAILRGEPIRVFNHGKLKRDFTYIDDIVGGLMGLLNKPPKCSHPHVIYNIGNNQPEHLMDFIALIEAYTGKKAKKELLPMQPGDVFETFADISRLQTATGYLPSTPLKEGLPRFIDWFRKHQNL